MAETKNPSPTPNPDKSTEQIKHGAGHLWSGIRDFFSELIDLREGLDRYGTVKRIKDNKRMQGANAWTLMCSIMIASLGLDLNSPAVIIGAMLISPLMSPILGIGLAVGINDRETLWISMRHFGIAIAIAIITSVFYFFITPFGDPTSEILARTKPTFLDVAVAFFGGLAGIISGTRKDISNAIPGVAIATALMPPLCVAGFGIANMMKHGITYNGHNFFLIATNSFYLFFLNATFVAIATYLIIRLLRFPYKEYANPREKRRNQIFVFIAGLVLILPSFIILRNILSDKQNETQIRSFIYSNFSKNTSYGIEKKINQDTFEVSIQLFKEIDDASKQKYLTQLRAIVPNTNLSIGDLDILDMKDVNASVDKRILSMQAERKVVLDEKDETIATLNQELSELKGKKRLEQLIPAEAKILFPDLNSVQLYVTDSTNAKNNIPLVFVGWKGQKKRTNEEQRLLEFIKYRAQLDTIAIARQ